MGKTTPMMDGMESSDPGLTILDRPGYTYLTYRSPQANVLQTLLSLELTKSLTELIF